MDVNIYRIPSKLKFPIWIPVLCGSIYDPTIKFWARTMKNTIIQQGPVVSTQLGNWEGREKVWQALAHTWSLSHTHTHTHHLHCLHTPQQCLKNDSAVKSKLKPCVADDISLSIESTAVHTTQVTQHTICKHTMQKQHAPKHTHMHTCTHKRTQHESAVLCDL